MNIPLETIQQQNARRKKNNLDLYARKKKTIAGRKKQSECQKKKKIVRKTIAGKNIGRTTPCFPCVASATPLQSERVM